MVKCRIIIFGSDIGGIFVSAQKFFMLLIDAVLVNLALLLTLILPYSGVLQIKASSYLSLVIAFTIIRLFCLYYFGLYNRIWEYASINELISTIKAVTASSLISVFFMVQVLADPFRAFGLELINWFINIVFIGGFRLFLRIRQQGNRIITPASKGRRVLIVGAGDAGALAAKEFENHYHESVNVIGFIDDDPRKQKLQLLGHDVLGTRNDIPKVVNEYRIEEIVIAMPSVSGKIISDIVEICHTTPADVKILPGMFDLIDGNVTVSQIREVQVENLLGREPVKVDLASMAGYIRDQVVLVTGAGGSIGSELCRQLMRLAPRELLLLDINENGIHDIILDLREQNGVRLVPLIKDIRDWEGINGVFELYRPDVVYHAAAHKHVPLMEYNPEEAIKNNCWGTHNVAQEPCAPCQTVCAGFHRQGCQSHQCHGSFKTDCRNADPISEPCQRNTVCGVRFGNVLGSTGSVVPLFKKQIAQGGPVTVTHEDMVRYFMTIREAVQLIIQAGAFAHNGEILSWTWESRCGLSI